jgi:hypothetical protein
VTGSSAVGPQKLLKELRSVADNPLAAELARVIEDSRAGVIEHAVEDERQRLAFGQEPRQLGLALLDRLVPQIASVKLD